MKRLFLVLGLLLLISIASAGPVYVAQGEGAYIPVSQYGGTCWYFQTGGPYASEYYGVPSVTDLTAHTFCPISESMTGSMALGQYDLLYVYPETMNTETQMIIPDVSWKDGGIHSVLASNAPINESGRTPTMIEDDLRSVIAKDGMDGIENQTVFVQLPSITIQHMDNINGFIHVTGITNLGDGDPISLTVDPIDHYAMHNSDKFTFSSTVNRSDNETLGTWSCDMNLLIDEMFPGSHHTLTVTADNISTTVQFPIGIVLNGTYVPPQYINYFANGSIEPVIINNTVYVTITVPVDVWHTATPTPAITDALGGPIDYPYSPGGKLPVLVGIVFLLAIAAVVLLRDYKRK